VVKRVPNNRANCSFGLHFITCTWASSAFIALSLCGTDLRHIEQIAATCLDA